MSNVITSSDYRRWPTVSCIVTTYQRAEMLQRALWSIYDQDFDPDQFDVMVIHDGPADEETADVLKSFDDHFDGKGISYTAIALGENSGYQALPKNIGIYHTAGDYICFLDDDNEWTEDHLSVLVNAIEDGEQWPDLVYGRREYIDEREDRSRPVATGPSPFIPWTAEAQRRIASSATLNFIDTSDFIVARGALWRLQLATECMWNEGMRRFGDWELLTRAVHFAGWRLHGIDHIVQKYYWHGANLQLTRPAHETPQNRRLDGSPAPGTIPYSPGPSASTISGVMDRLI